MWCCKCNHDLSECTCPDLEERLNSLQGSRFIDPKTIVDIPLAQLAVRKEQKRNRPNYRTSKN